MKCCEEKGVSDRRRLETLVDDARRTGLKSRDRDEIMQGSESRLEMMN